MHARMHAVRRGGAPPRRTATAHRKEANRTVRGLTSRALLGAFDGSVESGAFNGTRPHEFNGDERSPLGSEFLYFILPILSAQQHMNKYI